ncbi:MAG: hypothetical protein R3C99_27220 [Pirellulaceae bacterium]
MRHKDLQRMEAAEIGWWEIERREIGGAGRRGVSVGSSATSV